VCVFKDHSRLWCTKGKCNRRSTTKVLAPTESVGDSRPHDQNMVLWPVGAAHDTRRPTDRVGAPVAPPPTSLTEKLTPGPVLREEGCLIIDDLPGVAKAIKNGSERRHGAKPSTLYKATAKRPSVRAAVLLHTRIGIVNFECMVSGTGLRLWPTLSTYRTKHPVARARENGFL
jgi:hypothetical protein